MISLKKARDFARLAEEAAEKAKPATKLTVSVFSTPDLKAMVETGRAAFGKTLGEIRDLRAVATDLRAAIGEANRTSGVSDSLTRIKGLEALSKTLKALIGDTD